MYVAIDIGGTKTLIAVFSEDGTILDSVKQPTNPIFSKFTHELKKTVESITKNVDVRAVGIAAPGRVDYESNNVLGFGNLAWHDVDIISPLQELFEVPMAIDNDANMGAVGEAVMGAGKNHATVLYITVSTGIGTGFTFNGVVDRAMAYSEGGQMHFRHDGKLTRWETFASGRAFVERFHGLGKDITDPAIWEEYAEDLSLGFGSLTAVIQPEIIVVGGSMGEHLEKYRDFLLHAMQVTRSPVIQVPKIVEATYPNEAVINGCYVVAKRLYENTP